jgi:hypothetical protein
MSGFVFRMHSIGWSVFGRRSSRRTSRCVRKGRSGAPSTGPPFGGGTSTFIDVTSVVSVWTTTGGGAL